MLRKQFSTAFLLWCLIFMSQQIHAGEPIRIGWVNAMANTPVLIGHQLGYFKQNGLNVELRRFNSGPLIKRALEAGDLDVGYVGMPPVYHAYASGMDLKIIAKVNYGQAALIAGKNSNIKTLADLKGKRIAGVRKGSGMDVLLRAFVLKDQAKLDPEHDVKIIHMRTNMMDASIDHGVVDAAFSWEPYVSQAVLGGHADVLLDIHKVIPHYPWYVIAATKKARAEKRAELIKLLKAHKQAVKYLNSSQSAGNELIKEVFRLGRLVHYTGESVTADQIVEHARMRLGWQAEFMNQDKQFLQKLMDYSYQLGFIHKKLNADELIDYSIIKAAR